MQMQYSDMSLVWSLFGSHLCLKGQTQGLTGSFREYVRLCRKITPGRLKLAKLLFLSEDFGDYNV